MIHSLHVQVTSFSFFTVLTIVEFGLVESISKFDVWYFDKNPVCFTIYEYFH